MFGEALGRAAILHNGGMSSATMNITHLPSTCSEADQIFTNAKFWICNLYANWVGAHISELADHVQLAAYQATTNGMYKDYLFNAKFVVQSKHVVLDEKAFPIKNIKISSKPERAALVRRESFATEGLLLALFQQVQSEIPEANGIDSLIVQSNSKWKMDTAGLKI